MAMNPGLATPRGESTTEGSTAPKQTNAEIPSRRNVERHGSLKRELSPRDLNMIAIAGSVGTGLIIGIGASLTIGESQMLRLRE